MNLVVYDCEIIRAIPDKGPPLPGIEYCAGWRDFEHMGISVICAYQALEGYRVFLDDNFEAFKALARDPNTLLAGFNSRNFDDKLLSATFGITIPPMRSFDLLREIWRAKGLEPDSFSPAHGGYGLDAMAKENGLPGKSGTGANAALLWQQGRRGEVIDYCLRDVMLTKKLIEHARITDHLADPKTLRLIPIDARALRGAHA